MKKFVVLLAAVILTVAFGAVLRADDEADHPVESHIDSALKYGTEGKTMSGSGNIITYPEEREKRLQERQHNTTQQADSNSSKPERKAEETSGGSDGWHPEAEYRITKWIRNGQSYTIEIESKYGDKVDPITTKSGESVDLLMPIQFTLPDWVEIIHVDIKPNYRILPNGKLQELKAVNENGNKFRVAYPRNNVLLINGKGMTLWIK